MKSVIRHSTGQQGFTLVELMVGMGIGLLCTLVIATAMSVAEGQRRGTSAGSDAQVGGTLSMYAIQREVAMAGYGFASEAMALGCPLSARFAGSAFGMFPPVLGPVFVTTVGNDSQLRILASSKAVTGDGAINQVGYSVPLRVVPPHYDPNSGNAQQRTQFSVNGMVGVLQNDLMVLVPNAPNPGVVCEVFQVNQAPAAFSIPRADDAGWNAPGFPTMATSSKCLPASCAVPNPSGSILLNMGSFVDVIYSVNGQQQLVESRLDTRTRTRTNRVLQSNVVRLRAFYGMDSDGDGVVDSYTNVQPANPAQWAQLLSVRVVLVTRSAQFERDPVTTGPIKVVVGSVAPVTGSVDCTEGKCLNLAVNDLANWQNYRYKAFDTVIPLRNQRWKSPS
ncbi:PilW family protein [Pelomonas sp. CA6]|uniref:PilW family protein n=1 Tax=Pelomonas sp. CA6 TaxID=2907999 RepID=UPI001F4C228D|nr:PilW family protein [Pelomonas sp. CA6]MCH7343301.1 PilW family protein [Pelomonas sp. CA6]